MKNPVEDAPSSGLGTVAEIERRMRKRLRITQDCQDLGVAPPDLIEDGCTCTIESIYTPGEGIRHRRIPSCPVHAGDVPPPGPVEDAPPADESMLVRKTTATGWYNEHWPDGSWWREPERPAEGEPLAPAEDATCTCIRHPDTGRRISSVGCSVPGHYPQELQDETSEAIPNEEEITRLPRPTDLTALAADIASGALDETAEAILGANQEEVTRQMVAAAPPDFGAVALALEDQVAEKMMRTGYRPPPDPPGKTLEELSPVGSAALALDDALAKELAGLKSIKSKLDAAVARLSGLDLSKLTDEQARRAAADLANHLNSVAAPEVTALAMELPDGVYSVPSEEDAEAPFAGASWMKAASGEPITLPGHDPSRKLPVAATARRVGDELKLEFKATASTAKDEEEPDG